ncbi:MAG: exosortase/archaeosortase family protein [Kiritimatiellia bacterium]|jgi:exosortase|nr:exosortase/archaeosortase family protein [Kiritimatiellia bacterium]MDP6811172.1 exosortase/archaeosortase family protein [Kiritimatiellia bacterium]MDP7025271.1 exosortase/archaeosortase family protein [Kiritimatiellia bacterium]
MTLDTDSSLTAPPRGRVRGAWCPLLCWSVTALLLVVAFHLLGNTVSNVASRSVFRWMVARWNDTVSYGVDYSVGWFIPVISLGVLFRRREDIVRERGGVNFWGLPIILVALLMHWAAARAQQPRVSLMSLIAILWALPLVFGGWKVARHFIFPVGYLMFCIPWNFLDALTFPMRLFSSALSAGLLNGIGIGVVRSGTIIHSLSSEGLDFNVADPCSGLSSMLALLALTAVYANLTERTWLRQAVLFITAIPLAIAGNIFRIGTIAVVAEFFSREVALTLYHDYSAFLIFPVAILLMIGAGNLISRFSFKGIKEWISTRLQHT